MTKLQNIGESAYESIVDMVKALDVDYERLAELRQGVELDQHEQDELAELESMANGCESYDEAEQMIWDAPLSIMLSGRWPVRREPVADGFEILLSTGGPATRIIGDLDDHMQPYNCKLQAQDWFTPWETYDGADGEILERYCQNFYLGE